MPHRRHAGATSACCCSGSPEAVMQVTVGRTSSEQKLLSSVPLVLDKIERWRPLLDRTLGLSCAERSDHRQRSADGRSRRHRYRTACLGRIVGFSQFTTTYAWTLPAMLRDPVRGPSCVALVRIHADLPGGCDLGAAVENYMRVSFAKVASQFAQHFIDVGSS